jgi:hypothetical protein
LEDLRWRKRGRYATEVDDVKVLVHWVWQARRNPGNAADAGSHLVFGRGITIYLSGNGKYLIFRVCNRRRVE